VGRREAGWHVLSTPEVDFVVRPTSENGVGNNGVVLLDVELDQLLQASERVELAHVEPSVLE
jgi:hypothetical protein